MERGMGMRWREPARWTGLPVAARVALTVYTIGFVEGAGSHVGDFASRGMAHTYDGVWWPSRVLYYTLVAWDLLVVYLAVRAHPAVVPAGVTILALDLGSNWYYNWSAIHADPGLFWAPVGLLPMSSFGLFAAGAGVPLWRVLRRRAPRRATPDISGFLRIEGTPSGHYPGPRDTPHT